MDKVYMCRHGNPNSELDPCCLNNQRLCPVDSVLCDRHEYISSKQIREIAKDAMDNNTLLDFFITGDRQTRVAIDYGTWKKLIEYAKEG